MASNPWASQAAQNALLRYAPQKDALKALVRGAEERYAESVSAGRSEGTLGVQAARGAVAPTKQIFSTAKTEGERGRSLAAPVLAALSASSPFAAAAANEQAAGQERLAGSQAHALADLQQKKVAATELPAFTRSAATATLLRELSKLREKGSSLEGQEGAATASEAGKLRHEQHAEEGAERRSQRTSSTSRTNAEEGNRTKKQIAEEKGEIQLQTHGARGPNGMLSLKEQDKGVAVFNAAKGEARAIREGLLAKGKPVTRGLLLHTLEQPIPSESKEEPDGSKVSTKGHAGYTGNAVTAAALDVAELGGLSKGTEKRLRGEGYDPRRFGKPYREAPHPGMAGR